MEFAKKVLNSGMPIKVHIFVLGFTVFMSKDGKKIKLYAIGNVDKFEDICKNSGCDKYLMVFKRNWNVVRAIAYERFLPKFLNFCLKKYRLRFVAASDTGLSIYLEPWSKISVTSNKKHLL